MMTDFSTLASVRSDGCIFLGEKVTCDGFEPSRPIRIQTHVHTDHLRDFDRSKGFQKIVLSKPTKDLLIAERNADLPYRGNLIELPSDGTFHKIDDVEIALYSSSHMLGSVIPVIRTSEGITVMYAADFSYPLSYSLPEVDVLVVDATYGDPSNQRNYQEEKVIEDLLEVFHKYWDEGSVIFSGYNGRLQFVMELLAGQINAPFLVGKKTFKTIGVYEKHRGLYADFHEVGKSSAKEILKSGNKFVAFLQPRERKENLGLQGYTIILSAFAVPHQNPVLIRSDNTARVALTDHADFSGTIQLIQEVNPKLVIADNSRGGNAEALVEYLKVDLNMNATTYVKPKDKTWGG